MTDPTGCGGKEAALSVAQARDILLDAVSPVEGWETVPIRSALGRVLMRDVIAPFDVPAHDNSAMDGYAVRAADLATGGDTLPRPWPAPPMPASSLPRRGGAGPGVRIMTGAVMPRGAGHGGAAGSHPRGGPTAASASLPAGEARRQPRLAGEDLARGEARAGRRPHPHPSDLGLMASLGQAEVPVFRRLRVAFFSTGDELRSIGEPLDDGLRLRQQPLHAVGHAAAPGRGPARHGRGARRPGPLREAFTEAAASADAVITSGGVSVGEADHTKQVMAELGEVLFWKIAMRPGRPMAIGRLIAARPAMLFGLPGNPVAVMVTFYQIVLDALVKLQGENPLPIRPSFRVPCAAPIRKLSGRREFPRGVLFQEEGQWRVKLSGNQGSGVLRSMADANCFIVLPEDSGSVAAGELVEVQPFEGLL
jgi:molybdopterin molybdotransferase